MARAAQNAVVSEQRRVPHVDALTVLRRGQIGSGMSPDSPHGQPERIHSIDTSEIDYVSTPTFIF